MNILNKKLTEEQINIVSFVKDFTILMANEEKLGGNLLSMTLPLVSGHIFAKACSSFDKEDKLQDLALNILLSLRELNQKKENAILSSLLITNIQTNLLINEFANKNSPNS